MGVLTERLEVAEETQKIDESIQEIKHIEMLMTRHQYGAMQAKTQIAQLNDKLKNQLGTLDADDQGVIDGLLEKWDSLFKDPRANEPAAEEPAAEEPVVEEPPAEEPAAEE